MARIAHKGRGRWVVSTSLTFAVNGSAIGWRRRIAAFLRRQADRLDGRSSYAVMLETDPPIDAGDASRAIDAGFDFAEQHVRELLRAAATEAVMQQTSPELFEQEGS